MALQSSGAISINNINVELGVAGTTSASLNQASYRTLAGVPSGAISMSNFYGKSAGLSGSYTVSMSGGTQGVYIGREDPQVSSWVYVGNGTMPNQASFVFESAHNYSGGSSEYGHALIVVGSYLQNYITSISGNGYTLYTSQVYSYSFYSSPTRTVWLWFNYAYQNNRLIPFTDNAIQTFNSSIVVTYP